MKHAVRMMIAAGLVLAGFAACKSKVTEVPQTPAPAPVTPGAQVEIPAAGGPATGTAPAPGGRFFSGNVVETMNAANYTYVQVDNGQEKIWAAAPQFEVKVGEKVHVPEGMPMQNYESKSLSRKFEVIYFVGSITKGDTLPEGVTAQGAPPTAQAPMPEGAHPKMDPSQAAKESKVSFEGIKKADKSIAEVFAGQSGLSGKEVTVRGKVVKFSPQIMGKNWIHVQDGTGAAGSNDLTVTTADEAKVGDTVLVTGKITLNKDFGMGYKYSLIIEDGKVKAE